MKDELVIPESLSEGSNKLATETQRCATAAGADDGRSLSADLGTESRESRFTSTAVHRHRLVAPPSLIPVMRLTVGRRIAGSVVSGKRIKSTKTRAMLQMQCDCAPTVSRNTKLYPHDKPIVHSLQISIPDPNPQSQNLL
jgi:hypothetical protein